MNKIRTKLLSKEQGQERAEKMSKLRELKKIWKEGASGGSAEEVEGEERHDGRDEEDPQGPGWQHGLPGKWRWKGREQRSCYWEEECQGQEIWFRRQEETSEEK